MLFSYYCLFYSTHCCILEIYCALSVELMATFYDCCISIKAMFQYYLSFELISKLLLHVDLVILYTYLVLGVKCHHGP